MTKCERCGGPRRPEDVVTCEPCGAELDAKFAPISDALVALAEAFEESLIECPACEGYGRAVIKTGPEVWDTDERPCSECGGTGEVLAPTEPVECDDNQEPPCRSA
jgi:hypothetical protein